MTLRRQPRLPLDRRTLRLPDGQHVSVAIAGTGPLVVFFHGWSHGRSRWDYLHSILADRFTLVSVDLPGFGSMRHAKVRRPYMTGFAGFIDSLCTTIVSELHQPIEAIVSHSLGACSSVQALQRDGLQPIRIGKLVIVGAPLRGIPIIRLLTILYPLVFLVLSLRRARPAWLSAFGIRVFGLLTTRAWSAMDEAFVADARAPSTLFLTNTLFALAWHTTKPSPRPAARDVYLVYGTGDWLASDPTIRQYADAWKAHIVTIPHASHTPFMEQPDEFGRRLRDILSIHL